MMQNAVQIIDLWPSAKELARDLAVPYSTVAAWRSRAAIPAAYWRDLIHAAAARGVPGVTADRLVELHARSGARNPPQKAEMDAPGGPVGTGHFSRWRHVRRTHFATQEEINKHVNALRDEWSGR